MGQKVHPHGLRVGVIKKWDSRWYANKKDFGDTLVEDYNLRKYLKQELYNAGIDKIEIERSIERTKDGSRPKIRINIHCAKPAMILGNSAKRGNRQGRQGGRQNAAAENKAAAKAAETEETAAAAQEAPAKVEEPIEKFNKMREKLSKKLGKAVYINIVEVKRPDLSAQLVAENIAQQLEKRVSFRRAMKSSIGRTMRAGAKGIKTQCSGRLGGAEIARAEQYHEGTIPLQTIRADIDYGFAEANTTYGKIGVKVWLYKGEVLNDNRRSRKERSGK